MLRRGGCQAALKLKFPRRAPPTYPPSAPAHMVPLCHQTAERPPPSATLPLPRGFLPPPASAFPVQPASFKGSQLSAAVSPSLCPHSDSQLPLRACPPHPGLRSPLHRTQPGSVPLTRHAHPAVVPQGQHLTQPLPPTPQPAPRSQGLSAALPSYQPPPAPRCWNWSLKVSPPSFTPLLQSATHPFFPRITMMPRMVPHTH